MYNQQIKVIKTNFDKIVQNNTFHTIFEKLIHDYNRLVIHVYSFIKLYALVQYDLTTQQYSDYQLAYANFSFPKIDTSTIHNIISALSSKNNNINYFEKNKFIKFRSEYYNKLNFDEDINILSYSENIKLYLIKEIITSIKNNICLNIDIFICHFINYRFRNYINDYKNLYRQKFNKFIKKHNNEELNQELYKYNFKDIENINTYKDYKKSNSEFRKNLRNLKNDIMYNENKSEGIYAKERDDFRNIYFLVKLPNKTTYYEYCNEYNYHDFIFPLIRLNRIMEKDGYKTFNIFPKRQNYRPHYITIDSTALINIFLNDDNARKIMQEKYLLDCITDESIKLKFDNIKRTYILDKRKYQDEKYINDQKKIIKTEFETQNKIINEIDNILRLLSEENNKILDYCDNNSDIIHILRKRITDDNFDISLEKYYRSELFHLRKIKSIDDFPLYDVSLKIKMLQYDISWK